MADSPRATVLALGDRPLDAGRSAVVRTVSAAELEAELASVTTDWVAIADETVAGLHEVDLSEVGDDAVIVIGDERLPSGAIRRPPDWSPERLRSHYYLGHLVLFRTAPFRDALRAGLSGAQLYDAALRLSRSGRVHHLHRVIADVDGAASRHGWGAAGSAAEPGIRTALQEHLDATGGGRVLAVDPEGVHSTERAVIGEPLVSIVIPTRGSDGEVRGERRTMVVDAVRGIVHRTDYPAYEIVVVVDDDSPPDLVDRLRAIAGDRLRVVPWSPPFSFSGKVNLGVLAAAGEFVLLLNDDIDVIRPDWMRGMLALGQRDGVGAAGAMLYFEDDTIQHAGHLYQGSDVTHIALHWPRGSRGPDDALLIDREVSGATAACLLVRREAYLQVGGLSTLLPGNFNDVDLCQKLGAAGWSILVTPRAELYHYESRTRDPRVARYEIEVAWGRWEHRFFDARFWPYPKAQRDL